MGTTFYPVVSGRVSDALVRNRTLSQLQYDQVEMTRLQSQLASGQLFTRPSDNPSAAIRVLALQRLQESQTQRITNLKSADGYLTVSETSLSTINDLLNDVKGIASEGVTNLLDEPERGSLVFQLEDQINRLLSLSNTQFQDRYLFSGGLVRNEPFDLTTRGVEFRGDQLTLQAIGDQNALISHSVSSNDAFGVISQGVVGKTDLNSSLNPNIRLSQLNSGLGVSPGAIQFSDGAEQVTLDFANSYRIGDIVDQINSVTLNGRQLSATYNVDHIEINFADAAGGTLRISNVGAGRTASDLGIETSVALPTLPITGHDLDPVLLPSTSLAELNNGAGFSPNGGLRITQGGKSYSIDLAGSVTIEDMLIRINNSGASVRASINPEGKGIQIQSILSGADFAISELNGDLAARLGVRTFDSTVRLDALNFGRGIFDGEGADLEITRSDGTLLRVDLEGAITVNDVLTKINTHVDNQDPALKITASLQASANGIMLSAPEAIAPLISQPIVIRNAGGSQAATGLGLIPDGETEAVATLSGTAYQIRGKDPNPQEIKGVFNSLLKLRDAVRVGDAGEIERVAAMLDDDIARVTSIRGQIGVYQQKIGSMQTSTEDQNISAAEKQSELLDTDYAQAIAELGARQIAYQASLKLLADINNSSLFNYL